MLYFSWLLCLPYSTSIPFIFVLSTAICFYTTACSSFSCLTHDSLRHVIMPHMTACSRLSCLKWQLASHGQLAPNYPVLHGSLFHMMILSCLTCKLSPIIIIHMSAFYMLACLKCQLAQYYHNSHVSFLHSTLQYHFLHVLLLHITVLLYYIMSAKQCLSCSTCFEYFLAFIGN